MSLQSTLKRIVNSSGSEIRLIREFAVETDERLAAKSPKEPDKPFTRKERDELRRFSEILENAASQTERPKRPKVVATLSHHVGNFIMQAAVPIKQRSFLAEMALAYLVSHLEAFIKDYVLQILMSKPEMLRSSSTLTYEEATSHKSMKALRRSLAEKEVESIGYGSIDETAAYFQRKFNIALSDYSEWEQLREHIYRRNLIIHNQARINDIYRRKVRYAGSKERLHTDMDYVSTAATTILSFIAFVHETTVKKFSPMKPNPAVQGTPRDKAAQRP